MSSTRLSRLAWLPVPLLLALVLLLQNLPQEIPVGGLRLLPVLNLVFSTLTALLVAMLAAGTYLAEGSPATLLLGAGILSFGMASLLSGITAPSGRFDTGVTIHNLGVCLAALLSLLAALSLRSRSRGPLRGPTWPRLLAVYAGVAVVLTVIYIGASSDLFPTFFVEGAGPTPIRQVVLGSAIAGFAVSAVLLLASNRRSAFLRWYALGLILIASGLLGVFELRSVLSLLGWSGRGAQYLGGVYLLVAAVMAVRESGGLSIPLEALRETHQRHTSLVESSPDAILVHAEGRCVFANPAAARLVGARSPEELEGRAVLDLVHPDSRAIATQRVRTVLHDGRTLPLQEMTFLRLDGRPVEVETVGVSVLYGGRPAIQEIARDISERKRAEAALRESEQRWSTTLASIGDAVMATDTEGRVTFMNPVAEDLTGWPLAEAVRRPVAEVFRIFSEESREEVDNPVDRVLRSGKVVGLANHTVLRRKDGTEIPIDDSGAPIRDGAGRTRGVVLVFRDMSERRRAEEEIRRLLDTVQEEKDRLTALVNSIRDEVWFADTRKEFSLANPRALAEFGYSGADAIDVEKLAASLEVYRPDGSPRPVEEAPPLRALQGEVVRNLEEIIRTPASGQLRYRQVSAAPVRNAQGSIIGSVSVVRDITEQKEAELALRESEQRWSTTLASIGDAVMATDTEGRVTFMNPVAEDLTGWRAEEAAGRPVKEVFLIINEQSRREVEDPVTKVLQSGLIVGLANHTLLVRKDGTEIPIDDSGAPIRDDAGATRGVVLVFRDISERKQAEEALRRLTETLEERVAERSKLAEVRAAQLQALAVELFEAEERERRRIAGLLHDDLQQILAGARMQLQAAQKSLPALPLLKGVESLLEDSIAKSRRLSHDLSPAILHHSDLSASLEWLALQMSESHGLEVTVENGGGKDGGEDGWKVFLFRAAQELLFNAAKHARVGRARVRISRSNRELSVRVSDEGCGFDPAILEHPGRAGGFGLLSIRERAQAIGGRLVVESAPGAGSRFTVSVPLSLPAAQAPDAPVPTKAIHIPPLPPSGASATARYRVLLVDDHKVMRQGLISLIAGQPDIAIVGEAANGCEAIELARDLRPDVVVMDIAMPLMDGIEATRRIKETMPEVRVIGLSMFDEESTAQRMRQAGAEVLLSKATSSGELLKAIYGAEKPTR